MSVLVLLSTPKALMFKILPSKLAYTPNSWFPTSIPSAFTKIPLTFSLCLFILTSFTTMLLCVYPSAFSPTVRLQMAWTSTHFEYSTSQPHTYLWPSPAAAVQTYRKTAFLYTPCLLLLSLLSISH